MSLAGRSPASPRWLFPRASNNLPAADSRRRSRFPLHWLVHREETSESWEFPLWWGTFTSSWPLINKLNRKDEKHDVESEDAKPTDTHVRVSTAVAAPCSYIQTIAHFCFFSFYSLLKLYSVFQAKPRCPHGDNNLYSSHVAHPLVLMSVLPELCYSPPGLCVCPHNVSFCVAGTRGPETRPVIDHHGPNEGR